MATATILLTKENTGFPPIMSAAMHLSKCKALKIDRIRVERLNGALVNEFTVAQVEQFVRSQGLMGQIHKPLVRARGDYEILQRVYPGWGPSRTAAKETD